MHGEDRAADWYTRQGYEVLARNWRCDAGELDLVLRDRDSVVFCEVKARSGTGFGLPAEAVTRAKQARIRRLAARWLAENRGRLGRASIALRFDVACVLGQEIDVLEGAF